MRSTFRAAAFAAGAVCFSAAVGFAGFAGPSIASEAAGAPASSYAAHAGLALQQSGDLGLNAADEPARLSQDIDFSTPVATHAIAPALGEQGDILREAERDGRSLASLVDDYAGTETPDEEAECLARAVYYESKGEPLTGQLTVAEVIINRARSGRFPDTICGVVRQASQFSFVRRGVIPTPPQGARDWRIAVAIAQIAIRDLADGGAPNALFFHARHVNPRWRLTRVATIGNHVFYR